MTRVKICGLTNFEDACAAALMGADALGFVFAERSKRRADPEAVAGFSRLLPPLVTLVGVFQDQPAGYVREVMAAARLHVAQLHGAEDAGYVEGLGLPVIKALSVECEADLAALESFPGVGSFLLDSGSGGTGRTFDWSIAGKVSRKRRIILAGGLDPGNVATAVETARPWAVDAAGGVEATPGIKDHGKMREFIDRAKGALIK